MISPHDVSTLQTVSEQVLLLAGSEHDCLSLAQQNYNCPTLQSEVNSQIRERQ